MCTAHCVNLAHVPVTLMLRPSGDNLRKALRTIVDVTVFSKQTDVLIHILANNAVP